ncbi:transposase [Spirillospora sp. NPDC047418]
MQPARGPASADLPAAPLPPPPRRTRRLHPERVQSAAAGRHQQLLGEKIVLVWDNPGIHHSIAMRAFIDAHADWLRAFHPPAHAPDLNPAESVWSLLKRSMANFLAIDLDYLTHILANQCLGEWRSVDRTAMVARDTFFPS